MRFNRIHITAPKSVGKRAASKVYAMLPVSFFICQRVVEHGQCNNEKITKDTKVRIQIRRKSGRNEAFPRYDPLIPLY